MPHTDPTITVEVEVETGGMRVEGCQTRPFTRGVEGGSGFFYF